MSWLDTLIYGYKTVAGAAVAVVSRPTINFVSGATVVDNPGTNSTDVTISAGTTSFTAVSGGGTSAANAIELVDTSGGAFARTLPASPTDGQTQQYKDGVNSWNANPLTVTGNAGQKVEIPTALGTYTALAGSVVLNSGGGSIVLRWNAAKVTWFVMSNL